MSRLVISVVLIVVLGITGGAAWLVVQRLGADDDQVIVEPKEEEGGLFGILPPAAPGEPQPAAELDDDNDGLSNNDERVWGSDPLDPDTDNDGYLDGEEVAAGHDPTVPGPDDKLTPGAEPEQDEEQAVQLSFDRFFSDDVDLTGGSGNITDEYQSQYGLADQSSATLSEFASTKPLVNKLPRPDDSLLPATKPDSAAIIAQYLSVADNRDALANMTLYNLAHLELKQDNNPSTMKSLAYRLRLYREEMLGVPVPESAQQVHKVLLGYTVLLAATFDQIALWNEDPARSLVATRQLRVVDRTYYPLIRAEFRRLEALQLSLANSRG